jgi:hypothetical protein
MSRWFDRFQRRMTEPLRPWIRGVLILAVIPLALGATQRLWTVHFLAPQYPKGLELHVYSWTISGGNGGQDVKEINVLNHYVGMRALDPAEFADLDFIPFAIGALVLLALRAAAVGDVRSLLDLAVLTSYFGVFSLFRFAYTLYTYGHHLDPRAPIQMEGFMPPLLGSKEIANFTVASFPGAGTLLIGIFGATLVLLALREVAAARGGARAPA